MTTQDTQVSDVQPGKSARALSPVLKFALELGPLLLFFATYSAAGILAATIALMASVVVVLFVTRSLTGRWPIMPLVTAVLVLVFGGLTLAFNDATFIKIKATVVYCLFGAALLGGLALGKPLLPAMLDSMLKLTDAGWRQLTLRWGVFFFALAALNEIVWRTQSEALWVKFKVFGVLPLTMAFALAQTPLILRSELKEPEKDGSAGNADYL
jgi:intracellular septation protein